MKGRGGVQLRQQLAEEQTWPRGGKAGGGGTGSVVVGPPLSLGRERE